MRRVEIRRHRIYPDGKPKDQPYWVTEWRYTVHEVSEEGERKLGANKESEGNIYKGLEQALHDANYVASIWGCEIVLKGLGLDVPVRQEQA